MLSFNLKTPLENLISENPKGFLLSTIGLEWLTAASLIDHYEC